MSIAIAQDADGLLDFRRDPKTGRLAVSSDIESAVTLSLLCNATSPEGGGFWADEVESVPDNLKLGSLWWTRRDLRANAGTEKVIIADGYAALSWLTNDQVAKSISVTAQFNGDVVSVFTDTVLLDGTRFNSSLLKA